MVKQVSVFLPNEPGVLAKFTALLEDNKINIRALTVAETADYGILRIIVNNPEKCIEILRTANYLVSETEVLAFEVEDKPGGLHKIAALMGKNNINIEYLYSTITSKTAIILMRVNDLDKATTLLKDSGIKIFTGDEVYSI
ncbi:MAG: ACT domain-containing protein [Candidatus Helarchaeota archaeon]